MAPLVHASSLTGGVPISIELRSVVQRRARTVTGPGFALVARATLASHGKKVLMPRIRLQYSRDFRWSAKPPEVGRVEPLHAIERLPAVALQICCRISSPGDRRCLQHTDQIHWVSITSGFNCELGQPGGGGHVVSQPQPVPGSTAVLGRC